MRSSCWPRRARAPGATTPAAGKRRRGARARPRRPPHPTLPDGPSAAKLREERQKNCEIARETVETATPCRDACSARMPPASANTSTTRRSPQPAPRQRRMSKTGAVENAAADRTPRTTLMPPPRPSAAADAPTAAKAESALDAFFIPDFCAPRMVLAVVLIAELRRADADARAIRRPVPHGARAHLDVPAVARPHERRAALLLARAGSRGSRCRRARGRVRADPAEHGRDLGARAVVRYRVRRRRHHRAARAEHWPFLLRNAGIAVIVTALLLRYFFVTHQWQKHVRAEAQLAHPSAAGAHPAALPVQQHEHDRGAHAQRSRSAPRRPSRTSPICSAPRCATRTARLRLKEELELTRIYQRIEALRLGDRLAVTWDVGELPMRAFVPGLTVQPLLENAIYHGIEPLEHGGTVTISGRVVGGEVEIVVSNPVADERRRRRAAQRQPPGARQYPPTPRARLRRPRLVDRRAAAGPLPGHRALPVSPNERRALERSHRRRRAAGPRAACSGSSPSCRAAMSPAIVRNGADALATRRQAKARRRAARHPHAGHDGHRSGSPLGHARAPAGHRFHDGVRRVRAARRSSRRPSAIS